MRKSSDCKKKQPKAHSRKKRIINLIEAEFKEGPQDYCNRGNG